MLPNPSRVYLLAALDNTPVTLSLLLTHLPASDAIWDTFPSPDRFNLREIVAHLADWEDVFRDRFGRTVAEEHPHLLRPGLEERAAERGYAQADPAECLTRFMAKRTALTEWLRSLPDKAWLQFAHLDRIGDISVEGLTAVALAHDSYHLRQVTEWLAAVKSNSAATS